MMHDFDDDMVERSLAMPGEEADQFAAERRRARFMASVAKFMTDPAERARAEEIAARAGLAEEADGPAGGEWHLVGRTSTTQRQRRTPGLLVAGNVSSSPSGGAVRSRALETSSSGWAAGTRTSCGRCRRRGCGSLRWQVSC